MPAAQSARARHGPLPDLDLVVLHGHRHGDARLAPVVEHVADLEDAPVAVLEDRPVPRGALRRGVPVGHPARERGPQLLGGRAAALERGLVRPLDLKRPELARGLEVGRGQGAAREGGAGRGRARLRLRGHGERGDVRPVGRLHAERPDAGDAGARRLAPLGGGDGKGLARLAPPLPDADELVGPLDDERPVAAHPDASREVVERLGRRRRVGLAKFVEALVRLRGRQFPGGRVSRGWRVHGDRAGDQRRAREGGGDSGCDGDADVPGRELGQAAHQSAPSPAGVSSRRPTPASKAAS